MAPSLLAEPHNHSDKMSPTQENKPPIPTGAGAKKAMEAYFAGTNHMEFRQRSSSASRSTRTFSRGATPSRDGANVTKGASVVPEGAVDPDVLKNALKKIPSMEKISIRPTPPRSRSISRCHSPLPDEELLDESLPDFYKVNLKPTERTGSQTRDILLGGNRLSHGATPSGGDSSVPEFRRVALRRTPSREQLSDELVHKQSTLKRNAVVESSSATSNLSRTGSFTSLTAINKTVLSRRNSAASEDQKPEFTGFNLKKTGSRPGSRAGSPTKTTGSRNELVDGISMKKVESASSRSSSRRGSATSESSTAEFSNFSLKKTQAVKGDRSKFEVEQVSLKPIPVGEEEEANVSSSSSLAIRKEERASSVTRQRVLRETKFEGGDDEYHDIKSSLQKLKKKESGSQESVGTMAVAAAATKKTEVKDATLDDAAAKPIVYRRRGKQSEKEEEEEKVHLKPVKRDGKPPEEDAEKINLKPVKRLSFTSSIECVKKAEEEEEEEEARSRRALRPTNLRKTNFTSSLDNIAIGEQKEKVHLSCFSKEMGSNVDLVQVCQDRGEGKHEVKLEFEIGGEESESRKEGEERVARDAVAVDDEIDERLKAEERKKEEEERKMEEEDRQMEEEERKMEEEERKIKDEERRLHKLRKAPSIDGLFQRQDVQAAFTFTLPFQNEESATKLSLEIPNLS